MKTFYVPGALAIAAMLSAGVASAQTTTLRGIVSDQMCGAHHMMAGASAQQCTRECVGMGAPYALVVGDKVYTLQANPEVKKELYALAGAPAVVKGTVSGMTMQVAAVAPAK
ncbi:MAG TPA: hypothetical protein VMF56_14225 [Acidobacteriaceae bacterium]|nr:hypothetical protein [Acidobacteriaceae bacterium]